ncbi:MAG: class A beta-lactamase [Mycobacterium sp.]
MTTRRAVLVGGIAAVGGLLVGCSARQSDQPTDPSAAEFASLEGDFGGRLGVYALDTGSGRSVGHRADERFLMCSTVKVLIVSAILHRRHSEPGLLDKQIRYTQAEVLEWAPETSKHVATGMTVSQLCEAAIRYSDNTAANLLIAELGGPKETEKFVRGFGDSVTNTDRTEAALNSVDVVDGDKDTSTPQQMATDLRTLVLADGLDPQGRDLLTGWLKANTTGDQSIRASTPAGWTVGDKTGTGFRNESNDIAVIWPPERAPIVVSVYTSPNDAKSTKGKPTIAEATRIALKAFNT